MASWLRPLLLIKYIVKQHHCPASISAKVNILSTHTPRKKTNKKHIINCFRLKWYFVFCNKKNERTTTKKMPKTQKTIAHAIVTEWQQKQSKKGDNFSNSNYVEMLANIYIWAKRWWRKEGRRRMIKCKLFDTVSRSIRGDDDYENDEATVKVLD